MRQNCCGKMRSMLCVQHVSMMWARWQPMARGQSAALNCSTVGRGSPGEMEAADDAPDKRGSFGVARPQRFQVRASALGTGALCAEAMSNEKGNEKEGERFSGALPERLRNIFPCF